MIYRAHSTRSARVTAPAPLPTHGAVTRLRPCIRTLFGLTLLLCLIGCASPEPATTQRRHKFIRTQSENQVTLQWQSQPGRTYSVLYATDLNRAGAWRPVPGYETYMARDETTRITFTAPVPGTKTYYRLEEAGARP